MQGFSGLYTSQTRSTQVIDLRLIWLTSLTSVLLSRFILDLRATEQAYEKLEQDTQLIRHQQRPAHMSILDHIGEDLTHDFERNRDIELSELHGAHGMLSPHGYHFEVVDKHNTLVDDQE